MVVGQIGKSGVVAVLHVAVAFKDAHELAPILLQDMVVLLARGITFRHKLAISMDAQVRFG